MATLAEIDYLGVDRNDQRPRKRASVNITSEDGTVVDIKQPRSSSTTIQNGNRQINISSGKSNAVVSVNERGNASVNIIPTSTTANRLSDDIVLKTPQESYAKALNFEEEVENQNLPNDQQAMNEGKIRMLLSNVTKKMNDSQTLYPMIAIFATTILAIIILVQRISIGFKVVAILILLAFIIFTVLKFKKF